MKEIAGRFLKLINGMYGRFKLKGKIHGDVLTLNKFYHVNFRGLGGVIEDYDYDELQVLDGIFRRKRLELKNLNEEYLSVSFLGLNCPNFRFTERLYWNALNIIYEEEQRRNMKYLQDFTESD